MKLKGYTFTAAALGVFLLLMLLLMQFGSRAVRGDTVAVELGFEAAPSARVRAFDDALLNALERGYFNKELRQRLSHPPRIAKIDAFHADSCEVSQADFERFVQWQDRNGGIAEALLGDALTSSSTGHRIAGLLQSPASGVNYFGAAAYCAAAGGRLPWAEEWEAMAAGREGRLYPWGDLFDSRAWPYQFADRNAAQACATHPDFAANGIYDLGNNVMEWSRGSRDVAGFSALSGPMPGAHGAPAIRANARALYALSAAWLPIEPQVRSHHLGFRCVYEQPPTVPLPWGVSPKPVAVSGGDYPIGIPRDLRLARVAVLLPASRQREASKLIGARNTQRLTVGQCEVSRREYRAFLRHPLVRLGLFANAHEPRGQDYTPLNWQAQIENPDLPVSGINWWAADAFARWAGGRLPNAEEWQLLAAGPKANSYPWGEGYRAGRAATGDQPNPGPHRCGAIAHDRNAADIRDLAGNVSEWTLSVTAERGSYAAWVQGGNWLLPGHATAHSVFGRAVPLNHRSESIGFRVVYD